MAQGRAALWSEPLQEPAKHLATSVQTPLKGLFRAARLLGGLSRAQALDVKEPDGLGMAFRQSRDGLVDGLGIHVLFGVKGNLRRIGLKRIGELGNSLSLSLSFDVYGALTARAWSRSAGSS